ncbi:MAG: hypothetical protein M0R80_17325 [Proteobacteria bacterium]|jgi:hypothetical protein|nr:hypothetical protein [Pseudomonadota bacterium]
MTNKESIKEIGASKWRRIAIAVLVLGSLWGVAEVVLNDVVKAADVPFRAGILTGFGMLAMGILLGYGRRPLAILGVPVVAVLVKQMVVPLLGASVLCKANSCIAVLLEAALLAGVAAVAMRGIGKSAIARAGAGAGAGLASAVPFYFVGLAVAPCAYLMSFDRAGGFAAFMVQEGLVWAAFSAVLFPFGFALGARVREPLFALAERRPIACRGFALGVALSCWIAAALTISLGA